MTTMDDAPAGNGTANDDAGKSDEPQLLRIPQHFNSVEEVLSVAARLNLTNILVLSEREDGALVFLDDGLSLAQANWLADRMKHLMLDPSDLRLKEPRE